MVTAMGPEKTSCGMRKCRKFTILVNSVQTMLVISTASQAHYCALHHMRNGYLGFVNRLPFIQ
jgi:hypothetical protein